MKFAFALMLLAHNWYPADCCSGDDCHPIPCSIVHPARGGYVIHGADIGLPPEYGGENEVEFSGPNVRPSLDENCHLCLVFRHGTRCLFLPQKVS